MREHRKAKDLVKFRDEIALRHFHSTWTKFNERHGGRFHFHYTPIQASWVNQQ